MNSPSFLKLDISPIVTLILVLPVLFTITLDFSVLGSIPYTPVHSAQWFPSDSVSVREWVFEFYRRNRGRERSTFRCLYPALAAWRCLLFQLPTCHAHTGVSRCDKRPLFVRASIDPAWCCFASSSWPLHSGFQFENTYLLSKILVDSQRSQNMIWIAHSPYTKPLSSFGEPTALALGRVCSSSA